MPDLADRPTQLELASGALLAAIQAFTYPSDLHAREAAVVQFSQLEPAIDYLAAVGGVLTAKVEPARTVVLETLSPAARERHLDGELAAARWAMVDYAANLIHECRQRGILPRHGIDQALRPVDGLGVALDNYDTED